MSATLIIGIVLILLGASALLKVIFNVDFPFLKIAFAALFIYIGIRILTGNSFVFFKNNNDEHSVFFSEKTITYFEDGKEYNVIFGSAIYDFNTVMPDSGQNTRIKINTIFGSSKILLNKGLSVRIKSSTVFGGTSMPNGDNTAFGSAEYKSDTLSNTPATLTIESNTIFGGMEVIKK